MQIELAASSGVVTASVDQESKLEENARDGIITGSIQLLHIAAPNIVAIMWVLYFVCWIENLACTKTDFQEPRTTY